LSKNLVADEKWWAVSMTPLTNSGWSHWYRWTLVGGINYTAYQSILTPLTKWTIHLQEFCSL
jgi:hypothetical protein